MLCCEAMSSTSTHRIHWLDADSSGVTTQSLSGNRVIKDYYATDTSSSPTRTYYVRDAQGNVMGIFKRASGETYAERQETPIYGSSRLGVSYKGALHTAVATDTLAHFNTLYTRELRQRGYELTDHLGNVRATVSDMLLPRGSDVFDADLRTLTDYYPFGMTMPGRSYEAAGIDGHRYGYGGQERDDEISGDGSNYDYGARIYDSRVARWLSIDPLAKKYPGLTGYNFVANNPNHNVDVGGSDIYVYGSNNRPVLCIITGAPDVAYKTTLIPGNEGAGYIIDATSLIQNAPDAIGVSLADQFTVGGGIQVSISAVYFMRGQDAGTIGFYGSYGGSVGLQLGVGGALSASWYVGDDPKGEFSAAGYAGRSFFASVGYGPFGTSHSWGLDDEHKNDMAGQLFGPLSLDNSALTFRTWDVGLAGPPVPGLKAGASWGFNETSLIGTVGGDSGGTLPGLKRLSAEEWDAVVKTFAPNPHVEVGPVTSTPVGD